MNYPKWMNKGREEAKQLAGVDHLDDRCKNFPPRYLRKNQWERMITKFLSSEFQEKSKKNSENRTSNEGYVLYKGGSASVETNTQSLSLKLGQPASFKKSFMAIHYPINDKGKAVMSDYETYKKEHFDKQQSTNEDEEEESTDEEEMSTQGSTSYKRKRPLFIDDSLEARIRVSGGKTKGRILGMRPGDDPLMPKKSKAKINHLTKEEREKKKKEKFDTRVQETVHAVVNQRLETVDQQMELMLKVQTDLLCKIATLEEGNTSTSTGQAIVPSKDPPNPPLDLDAILKKNS